MSELEIYLMSSLQNIVDMHNLPNDRPCKCMQCKIARQAIKHAQRAADGAVCDLDHDMLALEGHSTCPNCGAIPPRR